MGTLPPNSIPGVRSLTDDEEPPFVGQPDGPPAFIPYLGVEVGTFINPREDLRQAKDSGMTWLMHHCPRPMRGYYKLVHLPTEYVAAEHAYVKTIREDSYGFVLCRAVTMAGNDCKRRAVQRSGLCQAHGGKLHPLDKISDMRRAGMGNELVRALETRPENLERLTRWQQLLSGMISVEELDDEELARGQCRDRNGGFTASPPAMVPKEMHDRMVRELFDRADQQLRENLLDVVSTMTDIAKGTAYEPADRIKAATWVFERVRGKVADVVVHTQDQPFEHILHAIAGGSRAKSRVERGVADEEEILEAQAIDEDEDDGGWSNKPGEAGAYGGATWGVPSRGTVDPNDSGGMGSGIHDDAPVDATYDPDDPLDNPEAGLDLEPDPLTEPSFVGRVDIPPIDPEARQNHEYNKAKETVAQRKALKEELNRSRRRRESARARGLEEAATYAYVLKSSADGEGGFKWKISEPKLAPKKRGNDDYRHKI